jgi:hypothetical protein
MYEKYGFPSFFPLFLLKNAIDLKEIGIFNIAWRSKETLAAIEFLANQNFVILGGDVFSLDNEDIESTGDSWYFEIKSVKDKETINKSKEKAILYIKQYTKKNVDKEYIYSILFEALK